MRRLEPPVEPPQPKDEFQTISAARRKIVVRQRLQAAEPEVFAAYDEYSGCTPDQLVGLSGRAVDADTKRDLRGNYLSSSAATSALKARLLDADAQRRCGLCGASYSS